MVERHKLKGAIDSQGAAREAAMQDDEYAFPYHYVTRIPPDRFAQHFVDTWGINYAATIEFILQRIAAHAVGSLVDIGCGDGRLTREIALHCAISKVSGVDYSRRAITLAKAMNQDLPQITFECADITAGHVLEPFDAAVLMEVFEHIPLARTAEFMAGVRRLLRNGGRLYLTVPHANKPVEYKHFQHFTVKSLLACLEPHFHIAEVVPFERRGLSRKVMRALLCNPLFVLNNRTLLDLIYRWYRTYLFNCASEESCQRLYVEAIAK